MDSDYRVKCKAWNVKSNKSCFTQGTILEKHQILDWYSHQHDISISCIAQGRDRSNGNGFPRGKLALSNPHARFDATQSTDQSIQMEVFTTPYRYCGDIQLILCNYHRTYVEQSIACPIRRACEGVCAGRANRIE